MISRDDTPDPSPTREDVDALPGATLLEFGTDWCGHCRRAQPVIAEALAAHPAIRHLRVIDGPGQRLGRSFGVKLWPTLIVLRDGREVARCVRPAAVDVVLEALATIGTADTAGGTNESS